MPKDTNEIKALKVIDALTIAYENGSKDLESAEQIIETMGRVSHSVVKDHSCYDVHSNWRKEIEKLYKEFAEIGFLNAR